MDKDFLTKLLEADISRSVKEEILRFWLLPPQEGAGVAPIQKTTSPSGAVRRPTKEQLDLRKNPKKAEELKEMEETLEGVIESEDAEE